MLVVYCVCFRFGAGTPRLARRAGPAGPSGLAGLPGSAGRPQKYRFSMIRLFRGVFVQHT